MSAPVGDFPTTGDDAANTAAVPLVASLVSPAVTLTGPATVLANDTDADTGEAALLRVTRAGASEATQIAVADTGETAILGTYGTLYIRADGTYVYKLDNTLASTRGLVGGVQATEQFFYTASNNGGGAGNEDVATLSIVVQGADEPVATGDTASTPEDTAVTLDVLANDENPEPSRSSRSTARISRSAAPSRSPTAP